MSRVGRCRDDAPVALFRGRRKPERGVDGRAPRRAAIREPQDVFPDHVRRPSPLTFFCPVGFERAYNQPYRYLD